ncbi:hypothetical protein MODO_1260 [Myroides odoratimimus]|uniref:Uncharacterized protein n=1 Tax=Myroides odoratimimus CCUG 10230 TaxID=883150 RepID=A0ABN0E6W1_9FLAO|nr:MULTISPECIES: hypothetical protein [Myroides]AJA68092.1 hypothetical protein MYRA21_0915 [Myroides sp. A21]EHO06757.1 hypothetical protein HMPREF9712_02962 [Myroides odoratimimus CCUG 10230]EPH08592.1 hypothetical protein HMPREF9713_03049 [Myroides odoratimimus CCUG 12700]MDM1067044.1 hypothetical protein [Myroides odoratimimus]MDM1083560.1 hypothetical protein [Myroides odoratimimus]
MEYNKNFKDLIAINKDELYIGKGNPMGKILFVGKEAAIDIENNLKGYNQEVKNNHLYWVDNISKNLSQEEVMSWCSNEPLFNPLYPYKGQKNTIYSFDTKKNIERGKRGTSATWYNYQKLYDKIYNNGVKNNCVSFFENSFITELSEASAKSSSRVDKLERTISIKKRRKFLSNDFYRDFPIVIVAVGHYVRDEDINIEEIFDVTFDKKQSTIDVTKSNYINIHYDNLEKPSRIVIHTNQLSMGISDALLDKIAEIVESFK